MTRPRTSRGPSTSGCHLLLQCRPLQQKTALIAQNLPCAGGGRRRPSFSEAAHHRSSGRPAAPPSSPRRARCPGLPGRGGPGRPSSATALGLAAQPGGRCRHRTGRICRTFGQRCCREFGVPALFAVPEATRLVQTGDPVTWMPPAGRLHRGRWRGFWRMSNRASPSCRAARLRDLSEPVDDCTRGLLAPVVARFRPRQLPHPARHHPLIHEKSVHEMFNFGRDHNSPSAPANSCITKVPMQGGAEPGRRLHRGDRRQVRQAGADRLRSPWAVASGKGSSPSPGGAAGHGRQGYACRSMFGRRPTRPLTVGSNPGYANANYFMSVPQLLQSLEPAAWLPLFRPPWRRW